jgi:hypothetical protein
MDLQTIIGFGVAVSLPVWLVLEEIARRRERRMMSRTERRARVRGQREAAGSLKRRTAAVSGQVVSRLSVAAEG